jgi:hypothetical protein
MLSFGDMAGQSNVLPAFSQYPAKDSNKVNAVWAQRC